VSPKRKFISQRSLNVFNQHYLRAAQAVCGSLIPNPPNTTIATVDDAYQIRPVIRSQLMGTRFTSVLTVIDVLQSTTKRSQQPVRNAAIRQPGLPEFPDLPSPAASAPSRRNGRTMRQRTRPGACANAKAVVTSYILLCRLY
jgi:hypothetical protein